MDYGTHLTRTAGITEKAAAICRAKLDDSLLSSFILSMLRNIPMFIAVDG